MNSVLEPIVFSGFMAYFVVRCGLFGKNIINVPSDDHFTHYDIKNYVFATKYHIKSEKGIIFKGWSIQPIDTRQ